MFITLEKNAFKEAVGIVSRFAENKSSTLPSLMGIAILAGDAGIKLRATNLETAIDFHIPGTIKEMGAVVLPAHSLRDISATFNTSGSLSIEQTGTSSIKQHHNRYRHDWTNQTSKYSTNINDNPTRKPRPIKLPPTRPPV
jgi:DNA polymerase III sliding clamp (beta) subunit (PCNA family)